MNEEIGFKKFLSTRLFFGLVLAGFAFTAYMVEKPEILTLTGFFGTLYGMYIAGNSYTKVKAMKNGEIK